MNFKLARRMSRFCSGGLDPHPSSSAHDQALLITTSRQLARISANRCAGVAGVLSDGTSANSLRSAVAGCPIECFRSKHCSFEFEFGFEG